MVQVQRVQYPATYQLTWTVIDNDFLPIQPIQEYLRYLEVLERSPNTIQSYAKHLKLFWEFLEKSQLRWTDIDSLAKLAEFISWLREPQPGIAFLQPQSARRSEKTINTILAAVTGFYEFQARVEETETIKFHDYKFLHGRSYKPFLHHITKNKAVKTRLLKLREPRKFPGCLTVEQIKQLIESCNRIRDKFLLCLLYESGLRIGEALGLRHEDICSTGENEIYVIRRTDNANRARAKSVVSRTVHVTKELMKLYADYLIDEYPEDVDSDYVFINIWKGKPGTPMTYAAVDSLFRRLKKKTKLKVYPHLFRHTHATELFLEGIDDALVQKRLGHKNVQTTTNTYIHVKDEDVKKAHQEYIKNRRDGRDGITSK